MEILDALYALDRDTLIARAKVIDASGPFPSRSSLLRHCRSGGRRRHDLPTARMLAAGGVTLVQLRDKLSIRASWSSAPARSRRRCGPCRSSSTTASMSRSPSDARAFTSAGTTWRRPTRGGCSVPTPSSGSPSTARSAPTRRLGLIDYAGIGGVYGTTSKVTKNSPIGTPAWRASSRRCIEQARIFDLRHRRHQRRQRRAGDRGRRRRRVGDLGAVAGERSRRPRRRIFCAWSMRRWPSEAADDRHRRHHRGFGLRRRGGHPGRPEDVLGARRLWRVASSPR